MKKIKASKLETLPSAIINTLRTGDADLLFNTVKFGTSASSP